MAQARKTNWFAIWISVAVVVVLVVVAGIVVWMNNTSASPGPDVTPATSNIDSDTGAIAVGTGTQTVDTYIDFMCPICNQFEQTYGDTLTSLVDDGTITLNIHPISILDRLSSGTAFSTRAASAMYCVAENDPAHAVAFMQAMYANQPEENSNGLTDAKIISIAEGAGVTGASDCITGGTYKQYVTTMTQKTPIQPGQSGIATPTIVINGQTIANSGGLTGDPKADIVAKLK